MASKDKTKAKGLGKDPSLCKLGQRMINTMLREERLAERDLQEKLKAISAKEHKSMVKLGCDSLEVRHDLTRQRSSSPVLGRDGDSTDASDGLDTSSGPARPGLQGRRAVSMLDYSYRQEQLSSRGSGDKVRSHLKPSSQTNNPTITVENHAENSSKKHGNILNDQHSSLGMDGTKSLPSNGNTSPALSPRLLKRRPVSDICSSSFSQVSCSSEVDEVIFEKSMLEKGLPDKVLQRPSTPPLRAPQRSSTPPLRAPQRPTTPPLRAPQRPSTLPLRAPQRPSTPPSDFRKPRPSSARMVRPKPPACVGVTQETMRGRDRMRLDLPPGLTPTRSRSPSPSRLSPDPLGCNLSRRGSGPPKINVSSLPPSSPLRKGLGTSEPISPDALRRRLSANEEDLQDRVQGFLKTLGKK